MIKLNPEICRKLKQARRAAKLSQDAVALEVGCKQSALSMFEQGDGTKLNDEVVKKLAEKFGVSLTDSPSTSAASEGALPTHPMVLPTKDMVNVRGFCPNVHCPSNKVYEVEGRTLAMPDRQAADPVGGRFCALCGEVLIKRCPNCGAPVHDGAICSFCGEQYVSC